MWNELLEILRVEVPRVDKVVADQVEKTLI